MKTIKAIFSNDTDGGQNDECKHISGIDSSDIICYTIAHYLTAVAYNDDNMKVHISSNQGELISGTFIDKFSADEAYFDHNKSGRILITNGKFMNVKVWQIV